jgi:hypothetical protein
MRAPCQPRLAIQWIDFAGNFSEGRQRGVHAISGKLPHAAEFAGLFTCR